MFVLSSSFLLLFHINYTTQHVSYGFCVRYSVRYTLVYSHLVVMFAGFSKTIFAVATGSYGYWVPT